MDLELDSHDKNATTDAAAEEEASFAPRPYQEQLLECALAKNTIIYLPTGAGKTFIALMAMKRMAEPLTRPLAEEGKRAVFLVNTVVLANQQQQCIHKSTALKVAVYTGEMNVDCWRRDRWYEEFDNNQVIVATCQIVLDVIRHGFISFKHINLIIFDECHHGRNEHPMFQLMRLYNTAPIEHRPRVIGLTGMLIGGSVKPQNVIIELDALESTFNAVICTVKSYQELNNVLVFSTHPQEQVVRYSDGCGNAEDIIDRVKKIVADMVSTLERWPIDATHQKTNQYKLKGSNNLTNIASSLRSLLNDFLYQMEDLGLYGASIAILSVIVELELKKQSCETTRSRQLLRILITGAHRIRNIIVHEIYDDEEVDHDTSTILGNSSPKIITFFMFMQKYIREHDVSELKALVFVQRRHTAKNLLYIIKHFAESDPRFEIRADFMVGNNNRLPESIEAVLENKVNANVVKRFRRNELNMIVASSVLEEGIDLQMCNLVISVDEPQSFRSYVQSKGRARMSTSTYAIMTAMSNYTHLIDKLKEYNEVDIILKDYLIVKAIDRTLPLREDIENQFANSDTQEFRTASGAILDSMSAVQLLHRYCNTLPNDNFTLPAVMWTKTVLPNERGSPILIQVTIRLPMQSRIKDQIVGLPKPSLKLAKRSAAFFACVRLYENKELNENLMPINIKRCMESIKPLYFKHWDRYSDDNGREAGTNKKLRFYPIEYPAAITNCTPASDQPNYLYHIRVIPEFDRLGNQAEMHSLLSSKRNFAIFTRKALPNLAKMRFFMTFGSVDVQIDPRPIKINHVESMESLRMFHMTLFRDIIKTTRPFLVSDLRNDEHSYFIVPILDGALIDWDTVHSFKQMMGQCHVIDTSERVAMKFQPEDYLHKVVCPWYRTDKDQRYVVTKVHEHMTPNSPFTTPEFRSYNEYFMKRYNQHIVHQSQFLIEVRGITQHLNRLSPGQQEYGARNLANRAPELLIPELCNNLRFPGDLWLKATLLPSILHRIQYLLHAETLRLTLNNALGIVWPYDGYVPEPVFWEKYKGNWTPKVNTTMHEKIVCHEELPRVPQCVQSIIDNPWNELINNEDSMGRSFEETLQNNRAIANPWDDYRDIYEDLETQSTAKSSVNTPQHIDTNHFMSFPWEDYAEPADLARNIENVYPVDLDYFNAFVAEFESKCDISKTLNTSDPLDDIPEPNIDETKRRIDILLITPDIPTKGPEQRDLLAALTSSTSSDVFDGERLEVLGDAFLKFSASIFLLQRHPEWHEGFLSNCKGQMVSNRNLFYLGNELVAGKLKVLPFKPRSTWQPPLVCVPSDLKNILVAHSIPPHYLNKLEVSDDEFATGSLNNDHAKEFVTSFLGQDTEPETVDTLPMYAYLGQQRCSDKRISDTMEAILGACVSSIGIERSFNVLKLFGVFPENNDYTQLLTHRYTQPRLRSNIRQRDIDGLIPNYANFERKLGYTFKDRAYLLQALTHPSFPTNSVTGCYQQLEFLGDAVLDLLITAYIYERCPQMHQGKLTDLRSALVNNNTLACLCIRYKFHLYILSQNALLAEQIQAFANFQCSQNHKITDQVLVMVSDDDVKIGEHIDVPKTLGDVFEALIGAVFLDSGNNLSVTWSVVYRLMHAEIDEFMADTPLQVVRRLYEFKDARPKFDKAYVEGETVMVTVRYTCKNQLMQSHGFGRNATTAKNAAAKMALNQLLAQ